MTGLEQKKMKTRIFIEFVAAIIFLSFVIFFGDNGWLRRFSFSFTTLIPYSGFGVSFPDLGDHIPLNIFIFLSDVNFLFFPSGGIILRCILCHAFRHFSNYGTKHIGFPETSRSQTTEKKPWWALPTIRYLTNLNSEPTQRELLPLQGVTYQTQ